MSELAALLLQRLTALGLRPVDRLRVTRNRTVLVSLSSKRVLSVHRAFALAPDRVLKAIVRFVARGTSPELRAAARHEIVSFHATIVPDPAPRPPVPPSPRPEDSATLERLALLFQALNLRHFSGALPEVPIRLSGQMRTRLGHLELAPGGTPSAITISRRHLAAHGWDEAEHTLLHEMVHLWQCTAGQPVDHGAQFRAKAREVGVAAAARRWVSKQTHRRTGALTHSSLTPDP